jgi:hypothetical protein
MSFVEQMRHRIQGMEHNVESCCDGGRMCETEGVDLRPETQTIAERKAVYGPPEINLTAIGKHWTAILMQAWDKADLPEIDGRMVAQMMVALKLSRLARSPEHADSDHDLRTYLLIASRFASP